MIHFGRKKLSKGLRKISFLSGEQNAALVQALPAILQCGDGILSKEATLVSSSSLAL